MINYEDELEDILLSTLKEKFEIDDEEKIICSYGGVSVDVCAGSVWKYGKRN